ncbi:MAG: phage portal protein family protein [Wolinella sp.]
MSKKELQNRVPIDNNQLLDVPKIDIKKILAAQRGENHDELIALYHIFLQRDLHLSSEMLKRRIQLLSVPFFIECEDSEIREFLECYLKEISFVNLIFDLSSAIPYGFSCVDMVYSPLELGGKHFYAPLSFEVIHPRFFRWNETFRRFEISQDSNVRLNPKEMGEKLLFHEHRSDSGDMGDYALMNRLLFTCALKHAAISANMQYFENLGVPPIIVQYDSDDEEMLRRILQQMQNLRGNSAGVFPKDALIQLLEGKAGNADFLAFIEYCDTTISRYILGNTLSGAKEGGSYALGRVHDGRRKDFLTFDCRLIENSIQNLLKRVVKLNFSRTVPFAFKFDNSDEADEKLLSEIYKNLSDSGFEIPIEHIEKIFSIQGIKKAPENKLSHMEKNSREKRLPLSRLDRGIAHEINRARFDAKAIVDSILKNAESFEDAYDAILEFDGEEFVKLEEALSHALANSALYGAI